MLRGMDNPEEDREHMGHNIRIGNSKARGVQGSTGLWG